MNTQERATTVYKRARKYCIQFSFTLNWQDSKVEPCISARARRAPIYLSP